MQNATNIIHNGLQYAPTLAQGVTGLAYGLTGLIVLETAIRLPIDFWETLQASIAETEDSNAKTRKALEDARFNFGSDLGHCVFYGLCAASIFPGSLFLGAAIFVTSAVIKCENEDAYLATKYVGKPIRWIATEVVWPALKVINELAYNALSCVCRVLADLGLHLNDCAHHVVRVIPPLNARIWIGVVALGIITVAAKVLI